MAPEKQKQIVDDEYKEAIQPVVDDRMRTDILGPHFCKVLKDYKPASEDLTKLISREIETNPDMKKAVKSVIQENYKESKIRIVDRLVGAVGVIILALLIWGIEHLFSK